MKRIYVAIACVLLASTVCLAQTPDPNAESRSRLERLLIAQGIHLDAGIPTSHGAEKGFDELAVSVTNGAAVNRKIIDKSDLSPFSFTMTGKHHEDGTIRSRRSFDLSPFELVAVGIDAKGRAKCVSFVEDPRFVIADESAARGADVSPGMVEIGSSLLYVRVPTAAGISEVRFYAPQWGDDDNPTLRLVGTVAAR